MVTDGLKIEKKHIFKVLSCCPMNKNEQIYPEGTVKISYQSAFDGKTDWALFTPGNLIKNTIVYLHGSFSHADQIYTRQDVRNFWLTRILKGEHPLLSINMRDTSYMSPAATKDLSDLLDYFSEHFNCKNYVLLGGSGGASSAMAYAVMHSEKLHGVIAMGMCDIFARLDFARKSDVAVLNKLADVVFESYGGSLEEIPEVYEERSVLKHSDKLTMPIVLTIGEKDALVPVQETRKIAELMKNRRNFTYIEIPGGDHDSSMWIDVDLQTFDSKYAVVERSQQRKS